MTANKIFITGATGVVGHYLLNRLLPTASDHYHLLVRSPDKFPQHYQQHPNVSIHQGALDTIEQHKTIIEDCDKLIHIATAWHDDDYATFINVEKSLELMHIASSGACQKIIYFSTASILNQQNQPNPIALDIGPMYVKSKYQAHQFINQSTTLAPVTTVFPTLVMGGSDNIPYSHISGGLKDFHRYISLLRFFSLNGSFHFIHCQDIAEMVDYLLDNDTDQAEYVLGQPRIQAKQVIREITRACGKRSYPQIPFNTHVLLKLAKILRIKIDPWGEYCAKTADLYHRATNPSHFGRTNHFPTIFDASRDIAAIQLKPLLQNIKY